MPCKATVGGLYAITPDIPNDALLLRQCEQVLQGGASVLQYRRRRPNLKQAKKIAALCRRHRCLFIVNNSPRWAKAIGADGVHLGANDAAISEARTILGNGAIIGVSCGHSIARAEAAAAGGADYVALGAMHPSITKPAAAVCPLSRLAEVKSRVPLPLIAIGGITETNARPIIAAGADGIALVHGLFCADDLEKTAAKIAAMFRVQ